MLAAERDERAGGDRNRQNVEREGEHEVLADGADGGSAQVAGGEDGPQVGSGQRQAGGADGGPRAGAHRDADIGGDKRRRIVDAVAAHRHDSPLTLEFLNYGKLLGRQRVGDHIIDANRGGHPLAGLDVVAGDQCEPKARAAKLVRCLPGCPAKRVIHDDDADAARSLPDEDDAVSLLAVRHRLAQHQLLINAALL